MSCYNRHSNDSNRGEFSRRKLLKTGAAVAAAGMGVLAGCTEEDLEDTEGSEMNGGEAVGGMGPASLNPELYADHFDRIVFATDVGADPTGEQAIDPILNAELQPGTLLHFPEGVYKMNQNFRATGRTGNIGITGDQAVIRHGRVDAIDGHVVTEGEYSGGTMLFRIGTPSRPHHGYLVFGGLIFDWSWSENAGMQGLNAFIGGQAEIRNVRFEGVHSLGTHGNMRVATAEPESVALVDSIEMPGGGLHYVETINERQTERYDGTTMEVNGEQVGQSWSTTGMTGHREQQGTVVFRNVTTGPWADNGIYVRGGSGRKIVSNCAAWNSGGNQIRNNGGDDWEPVEWLDGTEDKDEALEGAYPGSVIENSYVLIEHIPDPPYGTPRGILLQDGPQTVRNCEIEIGAAEGGGAGGTYGIGTRGQGGAAPAGPATVEDCVITLYEDANAVYVSPYSNTIDFGEIQVNTVGWNPSATGAFIGGDAPQIDQLSVNTLSG